MSLADFVGACVLLAASASLLGQVQEAAPGPILDGFTADPSIRVFGDTY